MTLVYRTRDWRAIALWTVGIVASAILLPLRCVLVAIKVENSPSVTSATSADSRRSKLLVAAPVVRDSLLFGPDGTYRILDAWIEERTHMESVAFIFSRTVREGLYSLIVVTELPPDPTFAFRIGVLAPPRPGEARRDSTRFTEWTGTRARYVSKLMLTAPFPDSLQFVLVPN